MRCGGSIIEYSGHYLVAARKDWAKITLSDLEISPESMAAGRVLARNERELDLARGQSVILADPHLLIIDGRLCCSYIYGEDARAAMRQAIVVLNENGRVLEAPLFDEPLDQPYPYWQFFKHQGRLFYTYMRHPWHFVMGADRQLYGRSCGICWAHGEARGSTPPISWSPTSSAHPDRFVGLFHSYLLIGAARHYYVGWYEFGLTQPFNVFHCSQAPLILPPKEPEFQGGHHRVYSCGLFQLGGHWHVSYGYNHSGIRILKVDHAANIWSGTSLNADDGVPLEWDGEAALPR